jgi:pimeloyl-ACP methyl ester carboxylesterase
MGAAGGVDARPLRRADSLMERVVVVDGRPVRYLAAGSGPAVLLLHGLGESPADWVAVLARLARSRAVYAPALPGFQGHHGAADVSANGHASFVGRFLDAVGLQQAVLVGHSLGGLAALLFALAAPERVTALGLVGGGGLGREVSPALSTLSQPLLGDLGITWSRTPVGATQRAWGKALLLFGRPWRVPAGWLAEQYRLARQPRFLDATLAALRDQVDGAGQRRVLVDRLGGLNMPVLVLWGDRDRVVPVAQARRAAARLPDATLAVLPGCGHLPQVQDPAAFSRELLAFLEELGHRPGSAPARG